MVLSELKNTSKFGINVENISFDLEAYCTELDDYKKNDYIYDNTKDVTYILDVMIEYAIQNGIIDNTHYSLLDTCLLYTLITRAKKRCLLLAESDAFLKCLRTNNNAVRQTWMKLIENCSGGQM